MRLISTITFLYFLGSLLFMTSCAKLDRVEPTPVYIYIKEINFIDSLNKTHFEPAGFQKFSDAWVYIDGVLNGVYELPVTFPVLVAEGKHSVYIQPGILKNGIASTRTAYEFVKEDTGTYFLQTGKVDTLQPKSSYQSFADFKFVEDFENPNLQFDTTFRSAAALTRITGSEVFKGQYSGQVVLTDSAAKIDLETSNKFSIASTNANSIFLELNYRSDVPIEVGMFFSGLGIEQVPKVTIRENSAWNKIYIDITEEVKKRSGTTFSVYLHGELPSGQTEAKVLLDELKLVY